ncbi:MAG: flagellin [Planctomycetia bacterium]|nr:MAG: flagellin [Planctomycetia bacterium]
MSRINTNIPSLIGRRILTQQNEQLNVSLERLSTGLRINTGKDDPAGLIASEKLRSEGVAIKSAIGNIARAINVVSVAEAGLVEVNRLLTDLEDLVDRSANESGISTDERAANQLQIDAILSSINRIANSTEFQGRKLLSGDLGYNLSGVNNTSLAGVQVYAAKVPNDAFRSVVVEVTGSAQLAQLNYSGATVGTAGVTLEIQGALGTDTVSFAANAAISAVAFAINQTTNVTGVTASAAGTSLVFNSSKYGSSQFVSVRALDGTFAVTGGDSGSNKDYGRDATVTINGTVATTDGLRASARNANLSIDLDLSAAFGTLAGSSSSETFQILGGGANFQIAPRVTLAGLENIGVASISSGNLGNSTVGYLSSLASGQANQLSSGNYQAAQDIVRAAQDQISTLRGRLGAFQKNTLETTANALNVTLENTTAAESAIRDTDFAQQTSDLTRSQILVQSATNVLRLANTSPQNVLALLG